MVLLLRAGLDLLWFGCRSRGTSKLLLRRQGFLLHFAFVGRGLIHVLHPTASETCLDIFMSTPLTSGAAAACTQMYLLRFCCTAAFHEGACDKGLHPQFPPYDYRRFEFQVTFQ
ncbi:hypothetical protein B0H19DRAFT_1072023 [Mycena capillaripes]|nr:hypothetical protein B0H19DRAFT_1072023 [Mycena capillaripes]